MSIQSDLSEPGTWKTALWRNLEQMVLKGHVDTITVENTPWSFSFDRQRFPLSVAFNGDTVLKGERTTLKRIFNGINFEKNTLFIALDEREQPYHLSYNSALSFSGRHPLEWTIYSQLNGEIKMAHVCFRAKRCPVIGIYPFVSHNRSTASVILSVSEGSHLVMDRTIWSKSKRLYLGDPNLITEIVAFVKEASDVSE